MQKTVRGILFIFLIVGNVSFSQNYWLRQPSPTLHNLSKCIFADSLNGWAAGDSAVIIGTSNGGQNWTVQTSGIATTSINDIYFLNKSFVTRLTRSSVHCALNIVANNSCQGVR